MPNSIDARRVYLAFARLHYVLFDLELDLNLRSLSDVERSVLAAAILLSNSQTCFSAAELVEHPVLQRSSRATLYRAIQSLEAQSFLHLEKGGNKNIYRVNYIV
jgi:hypothetical protein